MIEEQSKHLVSTTHSPNDISISLRVVEPEKRSRLQFPPKQGYEKEPPIEPNSLSEPKDYHYKPLFPPIERPQIPDPLMD